MQPNEALLEVRDLKTYFYTPDGIVKAVDGVDFHIRGGETLGLVGESGCGKSVTSLSIMGLLESPPGNIESGNVFFGGRDLIRLSREEMRGIRGNEISMIFQEPMTSLNPVYTIGYQISEAILYHRDFTRKEAYDMSVEMLKKVGIPAPEQRVKEYPHQLSGGMRQRVMIAMALACDPKLLIADEPTTALDVTIQAQILELMESLKNRLNMSIMLITHDLGVIAELCERVAVMYAGKVVEYADTISLFDDPKHPYTWGLMKSIPQLDIDAIRLQAIPGVVPNPLDFPPGCKYSTRCPFADGKCESNEPEIEEFQAGHGVRCWHVDMLEQQKGLNESSQG